MFSKISAILKLTRIEHSIMLVVAVIAAELIVGRGMLPNYGILIFSLITPIFVSMGSFAINDYFDIEVDKKNKKINRPIVNGRISLKEAFWIAMISFSIGVVSSFFINIYAFVIALIFALLAFLYSYKLKEKLLIGNIYIALSMVIPFIYGNYVVVSTLNYPIVIISATIFMSGLGREIQGTIRDYEGDRKRNVHSLPYYIGKVPSGIIAAIMYFIAIILSIYLFYIKGPFNSNALYLAGIVLIDIGIVYISLIFIKKKQHAKKYNLARNLGLGIMGLALLLYLISSILFIPI